MPRYATTAFALTTTGRLEHGGCGGAGDGGKGGQIGDDLLFCHPLSICYLAENSHSMSVLIIKGSESNQKLILALAKKIGSTAVSLKNEQIEDILFGNKMEEEKTNTLVSKEAVLKATT